MEAVDVVVAVVGEPGPLRVQAAVGMGWRPEIAEFVASIGDRLGFVELVAESIDPQRLPPTVRQILERGVPVVPHGVSLSLGGVDTPDPKRVAHLAACAEALGSTLVSEHIAFVRAPVDGTMIESGHLLPIPRTREAVAVMVRNVQLVQAELPVPIALEPIATLVDLGGELTEQQFLAEIVERTGAWLLPDVANLYANVRNHGGDLTELVEGLPLERIAYTHIAGGRVVDGYYRDTHTDPVPDDVLEVLGTLVAARSAAGFASPPVLLERDGHYPTAAELTRELDQIEARTVAP